jgi:hypothetical protein
VSDQHDEISAYAKSVGVDNDTALTQLLLFEVVGATDLDDEKQKEAFDTLLKLVDSHKLAASVRELAMQIAAPVSPDGTENPASAAAEDQGYSWSPKQDVSWEQVAAAVPDEAAALEAVLEQHDLTLNHFCVYEDNCAIYDEDGEKKEMPEEADASWHRLSQHFERVTGLRLGTYCWYRSDFDDDPDTGFHVLGAWQRSPAGKRFFAS